MTQMVLAWFRCGREQPLPFLLRLPASSSSSSSIFQYQPKPRHNHKNIFFSSPHTLSILFVTDTFARSSNFDRCTFYCHFSQVAFRNTASLLLRQTRYSASTLELASLSPSNAHRTCIDLLAIDTLPRSTDPNGSISTSFSPKQYTHPKQTSRCLEDSTSRSMRSSPPNAHPPAVVEVAVVVVAQLKPASPPLSHPLVVSRRQPRQPETPSRLSQLVHLALVKERLWSADSLRISARS